MSGGGGEGVMSCEHMGCSSVSYILEGSASKHPQS